MKRIFTFLLACTIVISSFAQNLGEPNTDFGTDGSFIFDPSVAHDMMERILVQEDGKILTVGRARVGGDNYSIYASRHNADGTLDDTYGDGGIVYLKANPLIYMNAAFDAVLNKDGHLLIAGYTFDYSNNSAFIICLDENGFENTDFGNNGYAISEYGNGIVYEAIDIDSKGRPIVTGYFDDQILVRRYNAKGKLDLTFGNDGTVIIILDPTLWAYCYAYDIDGDYANVSAVSYTTAVASGYNGSIQKYDFKNYAADSIQVNNRQYYIKEIGEQTWTLNNMAEGDGLAFRNAEIMSDIFGRYYSYEQAKYACNALGEGWVLPTLEDWNTLEEYLTSQTGDGKEYGKSQMAAIMADSEFNGTAMCEYWPVIGDFTNASGFTAIPVGYANVLSQTFDGVYEYSTFWTATETNESEAYYKYTICDQAEIQTGIGAKSSFGASVRCIFKN